MSGRNKDLIQYANVFNAIKDAIFLAIGNKDREAFNLLNSFIRERLQSSFAHDNFPSFEQFSYLPSWYYEFVLDRLKESNTFLDIYKTAIEQATGCYRSVAKSDLINVLFNEDASIENKKLANQYFHTVVNRFGDVINTCYKRKDIQSMPQILNSLDSIVRNYSFERDRLNLRYYLLKQANRTADEETLFRELQSKRELEDYHFMMVRVLLKVSYYWFLYLYYTGFFSLDEGKQLLEYYDEYRRMLTGDFLNDILFLYQYRRDEYTWERWSVKEHLSEKVYTVISPMEWIATGVLQYLLMEENNFYLLRQEITTENRADRFHFLESLLIIVQNQQGKDNSKWDSLFGFVAGEYDNRLAHVVTQISQELEVREIELRRQIADAPIDLDRSREFLQAIRTGWESTDNVRMIFRHFGKIENITPQAGINDLRTIGISNEIAIGTKRNLIAGENYIPYVGLERWGISIADFVAEDFFRSILRNSNPVPVNNIDIVSEIDKSINKLAATSIQPTIILLGYGTWKAKFGFNRFTDFEFTGNGDARYPFANFGGLYRGIPIVYFDNRLIESKVVIAAFSQSFTLVQESSAMDGTDIWNSGIREINSANVAALSEEIPSLARMPKETEEQILEVSGAVILDSYVREYFRIDNAEAYKILQILQN